MLTNEKMKTPFFNNCFKFTTLGFLIPASIILSGCSTEPLSIPEIPYTKTHLPPAKSTTIHSKTVVTKYKPALKVYSSVKQASSPESRQAAKAAEVKQAQEKATIDVDPYENIPENSSSTKATIIGTAETSSATKTLIKTARSDIAIGNTKSAISKLERGLRIEPQNPMLWHLIAKAHFDQFNYQQAISMAKKSIGNSNNEELTTKNWNLIRNAGEKSGDSVSTKEALSYLKVNP